MKLSRKVLMILFMVVLVVTIAITTYVKFPSIFSANKAQTSTTPKATNETLQLEKEQQIKKNVELEKEKKSEQLAKAKEKQRLEDQKIEAANVKIEKQQELEKKQKLEDQAKAKAQEEQRKQELAIKQKESARELKASRNEVTATKETKAAAQVTTPVTQPKPILLIDKINGKGNAEQAIVVTANSASSVSVIITTFEKSNGTWRQVASFSGNIGRTGFTYNKVEGDGHSPIGIFSLGTAFGRYVSPGTAMSYRQSTTNDFWVDDVNSPLYNTWQAGPASGRWNSAEKMYIPSYNYGFVINYNTTSRTPGKGSAIFFHVWSGPGNGTSGCTSTSADNVIRTLKWLNLSKSPIIIQGPMSDVINM